MALFFQTASVRHPMEDFAPHLETGAKLGYGLKVYRGYATVSTTDTTYALVNTDGSSTTDYVQLPPNCGIIAVTLKRTGSVALTNIVSFLVAMSRGTNYPTVVAGSGICAVIPRASVDTGVSTYTGTTNLGGVLAVSNISGIVDATQGSMPVLRAVGGTDSASARVEVTFLVMEAQA